jgi:hypothetical protein
VEEARHRSALLKRTGHLKTTLTLDRSAYLLGESIGIQITVTNPDPLPVEVLAPFHCDTGGMSEQLLRGKEWRDFAAEPDRFDAGALDVHPPTLLVGGWQQLTRSFRSTDSFGCAQPLLIEPEVPGTYRVRYDYGGPGVEFNVVLSTFKGLYHVPLEKPWPAIDYTTGKALIDPKSGKPVEYPRELTIAILFAQDRFYLAVTRFGRPWNGSVRIKDGDPLGYSAGSFLAPFVRIAESDQPIVSVDAHADSDENLFVTWKTADGESHSASLDSNREVKDGPNR